MCGIAGAAGGGDPAVVRAMCGLLGHRGPDGEGFHSAPGVTLGMRRLAIMDVAHGQQPVFDESGKIAAVFNGEIYNHVDLRRQLRGHRLPSASDTECLPHLFEEHGRGFAEGLNGMFAIAMWDARDSSLHLCVDQLGKKPLYYCLHEGVLYFASELHALVRGVELPRQVDPAALGQYLTYRYVPAPASALKGVRRVAPGHGLTFRDGVIEHWRYWSLGPTDADPETDIEQQFRARLLEATRIRMMGERPMGAFLSAGLDSSAVVAAMTRVSSSRIATFTARFAGDPQPETAVAARIAAHLGTDHHELTVAPDIADLLPQLVRHVGEPLADPSLIPTYAVSRAAREHIVVALTGDGGDEAWGGYGHYGRVSSGRVRPESLRAGIHRAGTWLARRGPRRGILERAGGAVLLDWAAPGEAVRHARLMTVFRPEDWPALVRPEFISSTREAWPYAYLVQAHRLASGTRVERQMVADAVTYLPNDLLVKVDIASMACSLEVRSPLLDHTFFEWALGVPGEMRVEQGQSKAMMRRALRPWLPNEVLTLPKRGFGIPLEQWVRGPVRPMIGDLLLDQSARVKQFLIPATVDRLALQPGPRGGLRVWSLLVLELFLREVVGP